MSEHPWSSGRHELKYQINQMEYQVLRSRLAPLLETDSHAGSDGRYCIRSLYFDDFKNTALFEKQSGIGSVRRKYRIRTYNRQNDIIKFERKTKINEFIFKESTPVSKKQAEDIISGDISNLLRSDKSVLRKFYIDSRCNLLKPVVLVEYDREAFIHPVGNVRVTFDTNFRTGMNFTSIFDPESFTVGAMDEPGVILEVKYNEVLPKHIKAMFPSTILPRTSFGKFAISRKYTKYNDWEDQ